MNRRHFSVLLLGAAAVPVVAKRIVIVPERGGYTLRHDNERGRYASVFDKDPNDPVVFRELEHAEEARRDWYEWAAKNP